MISLGSLELVLAFTFVFAPMIAEAVISARHDRVLRARGAIEPDGDVYKLMQLAYPGCFLVLLAEGAARGVHWDAVMASGAAIFAGAKALKYWAITSLGERWTFRVIVQPGRPLVRTGPYRFVDHPNYIGVVGELVGAAMMLGARVFGPIMTIVFGIALWARLRFESRILREMTSSM